VFAKACVKLISGSLSHENTGNQFIHPAAIITMLLLAVTAVTQIVCLNRGLKIYDSTLVVPVFYGIYTTSGFLDSLIFNDEVDAYKSWALFLVGVFILILIGGVAMLTKKKPLPSPAGPASNLRNMRSMPVNASTSRLRKLDDDIESEAMNIQSMEDPLVWEVGDGSDDEGEVDVIKVPPKTAIGSGGTERSQLMEDDEGEEYHPPR